MRKKSRGMFGAAWLMLEAQQVIALRLAKLAQGGPEAMRESRRMVAEKVDAAGEAVGIMATAGLRGSKDGGTGAVVAMLRRRVRANRKRLS